MSERISRRFYRFSLGLLFALVLVAASFSAVRILERDKPFPGSVVSYAVYIIAGSILAGILLYYGYRKVTDLSRSLFAAGIIFGVIVILQLLLSGIHINPITDCFTTIDEAIAMTRNHHGILDNTTEYYERYTNNYFFTVLMYYYFRIVRLTGADYLYSAVILNIVCIDLAVFGCFRVVNLLYGRKRALGVLYFLALCPTTYLFVSFPYTNTFSAPFVIWILYFAIRILNYNAGSKQFFINAAGLVICGAFGTLMRPTTVIAVIAAVIYILMKRRNFRFCIVLAGVIAVMLVCIMGGNAVVKQHLKDRECAGGFPATHWVMMGLNKSRWGFVNGQDIEYTKSFPTKSEKVRGNVEMIGGRLSELGIGGLVILYADKLGEIWGVGTDSYNTLNSSAVEYSSAFEIIYGQNNFWLIMYCQIFRVISLFMTLYLIASLLRKNEPDNIYPVALTMLGIMVFLMLWETNRKHNICFVPVLVILMESGFNIRKEKYVNIINGKMPGAAGVSEKAVRPFVIFAAVMFIISDICLITDKPYLTDNAHITHDNSFYHYENRLAEINGVFDKGKNVEQVFKADKPFNVIQVRFRPSDTYNPDYNYKLSLYKDGNCVQNDVVDQESLSGRGWYYMRYSGGAGDYSLVIDGTGSDPEALKVLMMDGLEMNPYKSTGLRVGGADTNCALAFNVYNEESSIIMSDMTYVLLFCCICSVQFLLAVTCCRSTGIGINLSRPHN